MHNTPEELDADDIGVNPSTETPIAALIEARLSRRAVLKGMVAAGVGGLFGCAAPQTGGKADGASGLTFTEIGRFLDETHHVAPGYAVQTLVRWGDPIQTEAPEFRPGRQSADEQERQFGASNDFMAFMPLPRGSKSSTRGLLCVNHELNQPHLMWPGMTPQNYAKLMTREQCETEMASQGHSVVEIAREGGAWCVAAPTTGAYPRAAQ